MFCGGGDEGWCDGGVFVFAGVVAARFVFADVAVDDGGLQAFLQGVEDQRFPFPQNIESQIPQVTSRPSPPLSKKG